MHDDKSGKLSRCWFFGVLLVRMVRADRWLRESSHGDVCLAGLNEMVKVEADLSSVNLEGEPSSLSNWFVLPDRTVLGNAGERDIGLNDGEFPIEVNLDDAHGPERGFNDEVTRVIGVLYCRLDALRRAIGHQFCIATRVLLYGKDKRIEGRDRHACFGGAQDSFVLPFA